MTLIEGGRGVLNEVISESVSILMPSERSPVECASCPNTVTGDELPYIIDGRVDVACSVL